MVKKLVHEWLFWALGCQRWTKWVFWSHFLYLFLETFWIMGPGVQKSFIKSREKWCPEFIRFPFGCQTPLKGVQGSKRYPKMIENKLFCSVFSLEFQWQIVLQMLIPGSCRAMLWHVLFSLMVLCSQLCCSPLWLFCNVWALLPSSLPLCIPREWSLHCSALSGPFATTGIFRKAPARQAAGGLGKGSPLGEEAEGESPRGGDKSPS